MNHHPLQTDSRNLTPPAPLLDRLNDLRGLEIGTINGQSLKYLRAEIPVLCTDLPRPRFDELEQSFQAGGPEEIQAGLVQRRHGPGELKLILRLASPLPGEARDTAGGEEFHILIRPTGDANEESETQENFISLDRLHYNPGKNCWEGQDEDLADLENERIRYIGAGDPDQDDILRLCALTSQLDFALEPELENRCRLAFDQARARELNKKFLKRQFRKLVTGARPSRGFLTLDRIGALEWFFPELAAGRGLSQNRFHKYDIFYHSVYACDAVKGPDLVLRLSALFHDLGKVDTRKVKPDGEASFHNHEMVSARHTMTILRRFGFEPWIMSRVKFLVRNHMFHYTSEWSDKAVRRFTRKVPRENLEDLIALRLADRAGSGKNTELPRAIKEMIRHIEAVRAAEAELKIKDLAIDGNTLQELGMAPGPLMGDLLQELLEEVKADSLANEAEALEGRARTRLQESPYRSGSDTLTDTLAGKAG